jgi:hypothetical protein
MLIVVVGFGCRRVVAPAHREPKQRIAHSAADRARLDARHIERIEHAHGFRPPQPLGILE